MRPLLAVVALGAALSAFVYFSHERELQLAVKNYRAESEERSRAPVKDFETTFRAMLRDLRTIARLPGVKNIDRYSAGLDFRDASRFDSNARQVVQEIYNSLATEVAVSELYIVPVDLEPDEIDPVTGRPQEPILTYDELIVGRLGSTDDTSDSEEVEMEEVEIYEYRLMKQQLAWFKDRYPREDMIQGLRFPALGGPEVVTCDNSYYDPSVPDDRDRSGLVYSVPFYGANGALKGCISAVILTHALSELLPTGNLVLRSVQYDYTVPPKLPGPWSESEERVAQLREHPDLLYSQVLPLDVVDGNSEWALWVGQPDSLFWERPDARAANHAAFMGYAGTALSSLVLYLICLLVARQRRRDKEYTDRLQREMKRTEAALEARSQFLANMSHELRTPLHGILSFARFGVQKVEEGDRERLLHYFDSIQSCGDGMLALVNNLLDLSTLESGGASFEFEVGSLEKCVKRVVGEMSAVIDERKQTIAVACNSESRVVHLDKNRIMQVIRNLIGNASKFAPEGSQIEIEVHDRDGTLQLALHDRRPGVPEDELETIFEKFAQSSTTKTGAGGKGLGLAISREIVTAHGGRIWVEVREGGGASFVVELPVVTEEPVPVAG